MNYKVNISKDFVVFFFLAYMHSVPMTFPGFTRIYFFSDTKTTCTAVAGQKHFHTLPIHLVLKLVSNKTEVLASGVMQANLR